MLQVGRPAGAGVTGSCPGHQENPGLRNRKKQHCVREVSVCVSPPDPSMKKVAMLLLHIYFKWILGEIVMKKEFKSNFDKFSCLIYAINDNKLATLPYIIVFYTCFIIKYVCTTNIITQITIFQIFTLSLIFCFRDAGRGLIGRREGG